MYTKLEHMYSMTWAVGHLDADCFYVSAERVRDPFLKGKPVGVLGNQGACVIAKSYEMKAAGVKTGEPIWEAVQKCPEGVYIKRDFRWYEALSRAMLEVVNRLSPQVEYYSIDEFFFQAQPRPGQSFQDLAVEMRETVLRELDLPVTVGIARSRTLAKLISDSAKPFGARADGDFGGSPATWPAAFAVGDCQLSGLGPGGSGLGAQAADGHRRDALVGAQWPPGHADKCEPAAAQGTFAWWQSG
jgi:hypothetical protein